MQSAPERRLCKSLDGMDRVEIEWPSHFRMAPSLQFQIGGINHWKFGHIILSFKSGGARSKNRTLAGIFCDQVQVAIFARSMLDCPDTFGVFRNKQKNAFKNGPSKNSPYS